MAHLHKKNKGGRAYYYIRESTSVGEKTVITSQVCLGTLEKILEMAITVTNEIQKKILKAFGYKIDNEGPVANRLIFYFISTGYCRLFKIAAKLPSDSTIK
jgi:hypothetical protein